MSNEQEHLSQAMYQVLLYSKLDNMFSPLLGEKPVWSAIEVQDLFRKCVVDAINDPSLVTEKKNANAIQPRP